MRRRHIRLIAIFLILVALVAGLGWTIYAPVRQERLNRALIAAIKKNDTKKTLALLAEGADANARDEPPQHLSLWRLLLDRLRGKRPAPISAPSALLLACSNEAPDNPILVMALLDRGAKVNVKDDSEQTPLLWASILEKRQVICLLVARGADVNAANVTGNTPLMNAEDDPALTQFLLSKGARINQRDKDGSTALMGAILTDQAQLVRILLQHGADVNIKTQDGDTPLKLAIVVEDQTILQMLKQAGAKE